MRMRENVGRDGASSDFDEKLVLGSCAALMLSAR